MMDLQYVLEHGDYVLYDMAEEPSRLTGKREPHLHCHHLAIAFDRESGVLHKHGDEELVKKWAQAKRAELIQAGLESWAGNLVVISGELPLEEVNKCLAISGYCTRMVAKLQAQGAASALPAQEQPHA